ncbi:restriction endonuclease subunit S [Hwanghaeella sp. 1Z406]|uniref:restriction endonuclease subunit S n=1 Tax=Hwanghaeella sp. 1Z406 TaxID=3402811 RepID=UPI003B678CCE
MSSNWQTRSFTEVVRDETGGNIKTLQSDFLPSGRYPVVDQGKELIAGYTNDESRLCKSDLPVVVFGDHTKYFKFIDFPFCLGADGTKVLRPKIDADERYLFYAMQRIHIPAAGYSRHFKYLKQGKIPLPPLDEQKRIAEILDQADALCRLRAQALDKLNTLGQAIFHEMFGQLDLPKVSLAELVEARSSLADPTLDENAELPHVGPEHIRQSGGYIEWDRVRTCRVDGVTSGKYRFEAGDVIYSKIRPYLNKVAIADRVGMCSADMYALLPKSDRIKTRYLHFILGSREFLTYGDSVSGRANIPKMNRKQLMAFEVPLPPQELQDEFDKRLSAVTTERNRHSEQNAKIEQLFSSVQHRAFRGEL